MKIIMVLILMSISFAELFSEEKSPIGDSMILNGSFKISILRLNGNSYVLDGNIYKNDKEGTSKVINFLKELPDRSFLLVAVPGVPADLLLNYNNDLSNQYNNVLSIEKKINIFSKVIWLLRYCH